MGSDDPKWKEAESAAKKFKRMVERRKRYNKRRYPGGPAQQVQEELLEAVRRRNQFAAHNVRFCIPPVDWNNLTSTATRLFDQHNCYTELHLFSSSPISKLGKRFVSGGQA